MGRLRTNTEAPNLITKYKNYCAFESINLNQIKTPIYLEIGSGKGDFLISNALKHQGIFYLGIEKYATVILKALKKIDRNKYQIDNLIFTCFDAFNIKPDIFLIKFDKLYLNFSDPWPKKKHIDKRLTSPHYLDLYKAILNKNCNIEFKTDNLGLFEYSLQVLNSRKDIKIIYYTNDLYSELDKSINQDNIPTEYEKKFVSLGNKINKVVFKFMN